MAMTETFRPNRDGAGGTPVRSERGARRTARRTQSMVGPTAVFQSQKMRKTLNVSRADRDNVKECRRYQIRRVSKKGHR